MAYLNALGLICALGEDVAAVRAALFADAPGGVASHDDVLAGRALHLGRVTAPLPAIDQLPLRHRSRNNALALAALQQIRPEVDAAIARFGAARVGVVLGTSTSGIGESERAFAARARSGEFPADFDPRQQEIGSLALMLAELLGLAGPSYVISTACSSSAKAMAAAARLIASGACDAVLTGGADSLCAFTVAGFDALESVSAERCNPMSANRHGINIGEAAALFLMTKEPAEVRLAGWGETSDAHHISAPDPSGDGALAAMREALKRAGLQPQDIDYLNLHGTATPHNDAMESRAVHELFGAALPCSSTKPLTGHTLGAAGALEAAIAYLSLTGNPQGLLPPHWGDGARDEALMPLALVAPGQSLGRPLRAVLSNSFAFGGSNAALVLERTTSAFDMQWTIEQLVPHAGRMSLLDRLAASEGEGLVAELTIRADDLFFDTLGPGTGVGGWVGIEYMAQAVAAWAGLQARRKGAAPLIGFLLGSRNYQSSRAAFAAGELLRVHVRREFQADNGLGQFDCRIEIEGEPVANAKLTVFGPPDPAAFLRGEESNE